MSWDDYYQPDFEAPGPGPEDDPSVQEIEPKIIELFETNPVAVYYETQLSVHFEKDYFHWVTARALRDLRENDLIGNGTQELSPGVIMRFYFHKRNRYWKRRAAAIRQIVSTFSDQTFTNALGVQGEMLVDAGLPRVGFLPMAYNVQSWGDATWRETNHDLDRVFVRDGLAYGAEIKNRLSYIDREEFREKLRMCRHLNLIPLFVARMMPRSYMEDVRQAGGFSWIMKYQFYPLTHRALANQVRSELALPVDCPARLQDSTLERFLNWHRGKVQRLAT